MQDIITVNHLSKSYGSHQVLNDISFSFQPGQIIALLGPNGSGKSSLIKILTGLIHDYSGEVLIDGEVPGPSTKAKIAYLPEKSYLADWMRAVDAINYIADFYPDFDRDKAMRMLDTFGLQPKQKIKSMSKGMQEKLQLILVMCRNAKLYIFDEPLSRRARRHTRHNHEESPEGFDYAHLDPSYPRCREHIRPRADDRSGQSPAQLVR